MCARVWLCVSVCLVSFIGRALGDCVLPQHPDHGRYQPHGGDCHGSERHPACDGTPGTQVPEDWLIIFRCDPGYKNPDTDASELPSVCSNGVWSIQKTPSCILPGETAIRQRCAVPSPPPNAQYRMIAEECGAEILGPGELVPQDCILIFHCTSGYGQRNGKEGFPTHCNNSAWTPAVPNDLCTFLGEPRIPIPHPISPTLPPINCVLPSVSPNRRFCSLANGCVESCDFDNANCLIPPGSSVDKVRVVCAPGYSTLNPFTKDVAVCVANSKWYPLLPECNKLCPPRKSEMHLMVCRYGTNIVNCSEPALPDTTISLECAPTFTEYVELIRDGTYRKIHVCKSSGEWSDDLPICKQACGVFKKNITVTETIVGGQKAYLGFFPWHAGLYYRDKQNVSLWDQKCGGSLISKRFILTACHCVRGVTEDNLRIALGKYNRSWDIIDRTEQRRNVSAISMPQEYKPDTLNFDIALVLMSKSIKYGEYIMPVCLDMVPALSSSYLQGNDLYVVGWGKTTEGGSSSDFLLFNTVVVMNESDCRRKSPPYYNFYEKFCAIGNNSAAITQPGDSGGGLTAMYKDGLHYIAGIISNKIGNMSVFTLIKYKTHLDWIENEMRQLKRQNLNDK